MRKIVTLALAGALVMALAGPAAASTPPAATYHGTWQSAYVCGEASQHTGTWNVTLKDDGSALVSVRIFSDGRLHAAWGGKAFHAAWTQVPVTDPTGVFKLRLADPFGAGIDLVFELGTDGVLRYSLTNYCEDGSTAVVIGRLND